MPDFAGGGEKIMYELARHLLKKSLEVKVIATGNPKIKEYERIKTLRLPLHRYFMNFAFLSILKQAKDCDLILASSYNAFLPSWLTGKLLKKPVICYAMGLYGQRWLKMRGLLFGTFSRIIEKFMLKRSYARIVFLSHYSEGWAKEIGIHKNTAVVNPGVELAEYRPAEKKDFVLFVGRFARQKGVDDILKVAQKLPGINFVMVGWGEEEERIKKIAPKNITFYNGFNNKKKILELYSQAPLCFFPSLGETFGLVIAEAMASGCAVVSTIPLDYQGFIVKPGDTNAMAEKIAYLMQNKEIALAMGKKNIELAKNYSWEKFTDRFIDLFKEVLEENNKKSGVKQ